MGRSENRPVDTAYLLFPVEHGRRTAFEILLPLTCDKSGFLLESMELAMALEDGGGLGPSELVYSEQFEVAYPWRSGSHMPPNWIDACKDHGRAVHPSAAQSYGPHGPDQDVRVHVTGSHVYLTGRGACGLFETREALFSEVMLCHLATAKEEDVPSVFRGLASCDPWSAISVVEDGLVLIPSTDPVRDIRSLLSPVDLGPILETPFRDYNVRERAIRQLGRLQPR